jgi:parvulin-like peptidyl-prolyl isomerase
MTRFPLRLVALASVLALAGAAAGCSPTTLNNAATMNGAHITNTTLRNDINTLLDNKDFVRGLSQQYKSDKSRRSVDSRVAAIWLGSLVNQVAIDREYAARHLKATAQDTTAATQSIDQGFGQTATGQPAAREFPKPFYNLLVARQARLIALGRSLQTAAHTPTVEDARKFYDQNKAQLFACASGKTVAHIVVATQDQANAILQQLRGGADFATLAQQQSTDTATKSGGGVIQPSQGIRNCYAVGERPDLDPTVSAATPGQPAGPVRTAAGYEILLATPYTAPSFASVEQEILQQLVQNEQQTAGAAANAAVSRAIERRLRAMRVRVAPQYGTWVIDSQGARVDPPAAPNVRTSRHKSSASTTTTTTSPPG